MYFILCVYAYEWIIVRVFLASIRGYRDYIADDTQTQGDEIKKSSCCVRVFDFATYIYSCVWRDSAVFVCRQCRIRAGVLGGGFLRSINISFIFIAKLSFYPNFSLVKLHIASMFFGVFIVVWIYSTLYLSFKSSKLNFIINYIFVESFETVRNTTLKNPIFTSIIFLGFVFIVFLWIFCQRII